MGSETGATTSIFPSDEQTRSFLARQDRAAVFVPLAADEGAAYDDLLEIDRSTLEPMVARPHSPDNVVPVRKVAGTAASQVCIGSCTNSSYEDLMATAAILRAARSIRA